MTLHNNFHLNHKDVMSDLYVTCNCERTDDGTIEQKHLLNKIGVSGINGRPALVNSQPSAWDWKSMQRVPLVG